MAFALNSSLVAQKIDSTSQIPDTVAIKNLVKDFLTAAGDYNTDAIHAMFTSKANISGASMKN